MGRLSLCTRAVVGDRRVGGDYEHRLTDDARDADSFQALLQCATAVRSDRYDAEVDAELAGCSCGRICRRHVTVPVLSNRLTGLKSGLVRAVLIDGLPVWIFTGGRRTWRANFLISAS
jgi:hypothetical protein